MNKILTISDYAQDIHLFDDFCWDNRTTTTKEQLVDGLLHTLCLQNVFELSYEEKRRTLHGKINTLAPKTLDEDSINQLNQLLQLELKEKTITGKNQLQRTELKSISSTKIAVWQGDITTLRTDAIVNAANNQMLGCFQPLHTCIDNAIHTAAGAQLRDDCHTIMEKQGFAEPTGIAKITRAYNLPSKYVIHTVGPIIQYNVTQQNENDLANAYINCLEICNEVKNIKSIAFCGISTGVFGYPPDEAARVAFQTVYQWLKNTPKQLELVVFNVFSTSDKAIYESLIDEL